jgi:uncharacterized membrane protein
MTLLLFGFVLFAGTHLVSSAARDFRSRMIGKLGENLYKGLHAFLAIIGAVLMARGFEAARAAGAMVIWSPPIFTRHIALLLLLPVFPLFFSGSANGHIKAKLKHPMLASVKLWAVAHLIANGTLPDIILFGGILAWAVAERIILKRRGAVGGTANPSITADIIAVVAGLALYVAMLMGLHAWLIGVSPI